MMGHPHPHRETSAVTRSLASTQRRTPTRAEEMLWRELRTARPWLAAQGFRVLRVSNVLLLGGSGGLVLDAVRRALNPSSDLR